MKRLGLIALIAAAGGLGLEGSAARAQTIAYAPTIGTYPSGPILPVTPVVSADRRYVRMTLQPQFIDFIEFDTFTIPGAVSSFGNGGGIGGGLGGGLGGNGLGGGGGGAFGGGFRNVGPGGRARVQGVTGPAVNPYAANPGAGLGLAGDPSYISGSQLALLQQQAQAAQQAQARAQAQAQAKAKAKSKAPARGRTTRRAGR